MQTETIANLLTDVTRRGGIDSNRYSSSVIMRVFTIAARQITQEITRAMKDNGFQGEISTHDLVANQREYLFPSDYLKIEKIDLKLDGSNFRTANEFDASEVPDKLSAEADIVDRFSNEEPYVDYFDESFFIYSGAISNVTGGIKIWYNKDIVGQDTNGNDITSFTASTDLPTLMPFAAQALVLWAIIDWYEGHPDSKKLARFNTELWGNPGGRPSDDRVIGGLMKRVINYYADRAPNRKIEMSSGYRQEDFE